jgi:Subtilase family
MSNQDLFSRRELVVFIDPNQRGAEPLEQITLVNGAQPPAPHALNTPGAPDAPGAGEVTVPLTPLFGIPAKKLVREASGADGSDLSLYYRAEVPDDGQMEELVDALNADPRVAGAYIKPAPELPERDDYAINTQLPCPLEVPLTSPDFSDRQDYLGPAPGGVEARHAWELPGGRGANVRIIDIEGAWRFSHEDLSQNQGGVVGGAVSPDLHWRNHGTAVAGSFSGDGNGVGVTGICPDANVRAISIFGNGMGSAAAIRKAASMLSPGDIILIELHYAGPRHAFTPRLDQLGYIPVEWWPDEFAAIREATSRGILVVEAAGNGAEDLDAPLYDTPGRGFPSTWSNPFKRGRDPRSPDSGAILVGAGAPPPGTHGRNVHGPDRSRLEFSNYGSCVDVQGWGREVTSTGYGDLQGGSCEDYWYTDQFSGTSSASPIVVGVLACLQGILRERGAPLLTPVTARKLLRSCGSLQRDAPGRPATQRIGTRPNLRELIARLIPNAASPRAHRPARLANGSSLSSMTRASTASSSGTSDLPSISVDADHGQPSRITIQIDLGAAKGG